MSRRVTILMYHYVRDLKNSRYPAIKGLDLNLFKEQLEYLENHYVFVTIEEVIEALENGNALPSKAVLLTFNDCYSDHFQNVFPLLDKKGIQGCFYPEVAAIEEKKVIINHKVHFILASAPSSAVVKDEILKLLDDLGSNYDLKPTEQYYRKLANSSEYDSKETIFVKRMLQRELPDEVQEIIADHLFEAFVGVDEDVFHSELYLDEKQVKCMINHGMHFGILGYHHRRYNDLDYSAQKKEIMAANRFLIEMGINKSTLSASYPWGSYNQDTLNILKDIGCKVAFTTQTAVANLDQNSKLELPRLDTNEIPKERQESPNRWYAVA